MRAPGTIVLALVLAAASRAATPLAPDAPLAITGVTVVDAERVVADATVVLRDGRIESVKTRGRVAPGLRAVDARGKFLVPGLVDAQVHLHRTGGLYSRPDLLDLAAIEPVAVAQATARAELHTNLRRYLRAGITTVYDGGGPTWNHALRAHAAETALAPRVLASGPLISTVARPAFGAEDPPLVHVATPAAARDEVLVQAAAGPGLVQLWFALEDGLALERAVAVVAAAIDAAHGQGLRVAVRVGTPATARRAVELGADLLVLGALDAPLDDALLRALARQRTPVVVALAAAENLLEVRSQRLAFTPAEWVWADPRRLDELARLPLLRQELLPPALRRASTERPPVALAPHALGDLRRLWDAGVQLALGSDAGDPGTPHGPALFRDLELLTQAGLSPLQALEAATVNGARALGLPDAGLVRAGHAADLVLLDADPRLGVRNLGRIHAVVRGGRWLEPREVLPERTIDVVWRQVAAFDARDAAAFAGTFAEHAAIMDGDEVEVRGRAAIMDRYADLFEREPLGRIQVDDELVEGRTAVLRHRVHGMGADGRKVLVVYEVEDGLVSHVWYR